MIFSSIGFGNNEDYFLSLFVKTLVYSDKPAAVETVEANNKEFISDIHFGMLGEYVKKESSLNLYYIDRSIDLNSDLKNVSNFFLKKSESVQKSPYILSVEFKINI